MRVGREREEEIDPSFLVEARLRLKRADTPGVGSSGVSRRLPSDADHRHRPSPSANTKKVCAMAA